MEKDATAIRENNMKRMVWIILVLVLAPIVLYPVMHKYNIAGARMWGHEKAHRMGRTISFLSAVAFEIQSQVDYNKISPPQSTDAMTKLFQKESECFEAFWTNFARYYDSKTEKMIDAWEIPIYLRVDGVNSYSLISFGPNRRDDSGKRDDMVYEFDPFEYVDKEEIN